MSEELNKIGELIKTQDNRITANPIFVVEKLVRDWGYDSAYRDEYKWLDHENEGCEADEIETAELDELYKLGEGKGSWEKCYYGDRWEFVTACFTEQGCKDYLNLNGHNLGKTRIYAHGSYRNNEWQTVRNALINQNEFKDTNVVSKGEK